MEGLAWPVKPHVTPFPFSWFLIAQKPLLFSVIEYLHAGEVPFDMFVVPAGSEA